MSVGDELWVDVTRRAGGRCEYCRMHQSLQGATFHVEHVIPRCRGGATALDNLAWACPGCNLRKADRVDGSDPDGGARVPLFHPRLDQWRDHFAWNAQWIMPLTPTGRATVKALDLNHPRRLTVRRMEQLFHLFPPAS